MKNWNVYMVYCEDYENVYKIAVPAPNLKSAKDFIARSSLDVIKIKVDEDFCIDTDMLFKVMTQGGFGEVEADVVMRILNSIGLSMQCIKTRG